MAEDLRWTFCPECGCEAFRQGEKTERECQRCRQSYFTDADYTDACRRNIVRLMANGEKENATLRAEVERLNGVVELVHKAGLNHAERERRSAERLAVCLEALEKIAEAGCPSQELNPAGEWQSCGECESCIAKEALSPAPDTSVLTCDFQEVEAIKDALTFGTGVMKDGKRIPPEDFYKSEAELAREKALKEAAEIADQHIKRGIVTAAIPAAILALLKKDEGRVG